MLPIVLSFDSAFAQVSSKETKQVVRSPIPDKLVVLTFDDSSKSHYTIVRPLLLKYGFGATFFITEGFDFKENKRDYMTWDEIAELHKAGFEIGNHTRDHLGITPANVPKLAEQLNAIASQCTKHGIPTPVTFAWPGNANTPDAFPVLKEHGIQFARRGGAPEYPYEQGQGFAFEPGKDHPLLLPSAGDARPRWTIENFIQAVEQARDGRIAILQFHGTPDTAHDWVSTIQQNFEAYLHYLATHGFKVVAMRDLAQYQNTTEIPSDHQEIIKSRQESLRNPKKEDSLQSKSSIIRDIRKLPQLEEPFPGDWLVDKTQRKAGLFRGEQENEVVLDNGLIRRTFLVSPNLACIGLDHLSTNESFLRSVRPECRVRLDGETYDVGGLTGQSVNNFLSPTAKKELVNDEKSFQFGGEIHLNPISPRIEWKARDAWLSGKSSWPPKGIEVSFRFMPPAKAGKSLEGVHVDVHYALYDGIPLVEKWITIDNKGSATHRLESFTSEILACVEASSQVEDLAEPLLPNIHVETDFTSVAMHGGSSQRDTVHWLPDPNYSTQVNYLLQTRCLMECSPPLGPNAAIPPGEHFDSFRTWVLPLETRDETRQMLSLARMYQTIAPWVMENPLIHHVRSAEPKAVRLAIDQCAEVGFELVIMTFGSGFNIENTSDAYLASIKELADYAHSKGVALGGYSLLASRRVSEEHDVVNPKTGKTGGFARFGNSPCLESQWGIEYFDKLQKFFEKTGCDVLEHDGSYPGDPCASTSHPGHEGYEDSRWKQWTKISQFYRWCRERGIYLNVPDWYFLSGASKTGMGYRETNWSLPRAQQEIIERQNIFDGTRYKLPSMGWMFVPLTQYHGGGAEATIEPLHEHRDHYERRLQNLFGAGVQACFRGPRLYDTVETQTMVKQWVDFYKSHRAILDSPLIGLRRADGRDWDGWLHVNPAIESRGFAMIYNPTDDAITRTIKIPLRYAGLSAKATVRVNQGEPKEIALDRHEQATMRLEIPARNAIGIEFTK